MSKARDLADFISTGSILSDGTIESTEISGVTATAAELNTLDGITATTSELNGVAGINTNVQTQLDLKADTSSLGTVASLDVGTGANNIVQLNSSGQLPAVDGSNLTGLSSAGNLFSALADGTVTDGDMLILRSDGDVAKVAVESTTYPFDTSNASLLIDNTYTAMEAYRAAINKADGTKSAFIAKNLSGVGKVYALTDTNGTLSVSSSGQFTSNFQGGDICHLTGDYWLIAWRGSSEFGYCMTWNASTNSFGTQYTFRSDSVYSVSCDSPKDGLTDADYAAITFFDNGQGNNLRLLNVYHLGSGSLTVNSISTIQGDDCNGPIDIFFDTIGTQSQGFIAFRSNSNADARVISFRRAGSSMSGGGDVSLQSNLTFPSFAIGGISIHQNDNQTGSFVVSYVTTGNNLNVCPFTYTPGSGSLPSNVTRGTTSAVDAVGGGTGLSVFLHRNTTGLGSVMYYNDVEDKVQVTDFSVSSNAITVGNTNDVATNSSGTTNSRWQSIAAIDKNDSYKFIGFYSDGNDPYGEVLTASYTESATNLSLSPFVGVAQNSATTGQTVSVMTKGGIDDAQTGLTSGTTYYIQDNGSLGTSAGSVSKVAGTALSSTTLLIGD